MLATSDSTALRVFISRSALRDGALRALHSGAEIFDLRRDAWGHGVEIVAPVLAEAGVRAVLIDQDGPAEQLRKLGLIPSVEGRADADPAVVWGFPDASGRQSGMPVMRACGRVLSTKAIPAGAGVSYGYHYRAPVDTRLALVTGGYAQGLMRALGGRVHVDIGGRAHPIVGRIAMDACVVETSDARVNAGDEVSFFGGRSPVSSNLADWARATGLTIAELAYVVGVRSVRREEA